ncbi:MAG TPA: ABC transporter ATP-binding protein [Gammaproteobacteria bacterium]|nr:ABC transporter ATP-binding protein [Gammaproteobacteria bacterium]
MSPRDRTGLVVDGIYTAYDKADVLEDVSLKAESGKITCLLGSNGSGKSTLIRSILGLTPPSRGHIFFGGTELTGLPTHNIVAAGVACIPEGRKVFPKLTVEENLRLGGFQERSKEALWKRIQQVYEAFPVLEQRKEQIAGTMSGGEQAMISIGRGLMSAPRLLLLDEPSLGLSPALVKENFQIIQRINEQGITVFLVEQNVHQTLGIADYGYVLSKGRVVAAGAADELSRSREVHQAYFG